MFYFSETMLFSSVRKAEWFSLGKLLGYLLACGGQLFAEKPVGICGSEYDALMISATN